VTSARGAAAGRRLAAGALHGAWRLRALGGWRVPAQGPVILAVNHTHNVDGPALLALAPRPVHFLIKKEAFAGPMGPFLRGIGQLPVDRGSADRAAVAAAIAVLDAGGVLGIFPEGTRTSGEFATIRAGLAYFALRSGAPIVPVAMLGGNEAPGRLTPALPPLRARIDAVFGDPFTAGERDGRRTRAALDDATGRIQERLAAHLKEARRLTGR
jgi:1-acyl-sn-glycerol-3-phosphate acyltransferase